VDEVAVALFDGCMDRLGGDDAKNRIVARPKALGADDHVGLHPPVIHGEVPPRPADARHDLVNNEKDVVAVADLANPLKISVFRHQGPGGGPHHRLGHKSGNGVGTLVQDRLFQVVGALQGAALRFPPKGAPVAVGGDDMGGMADQGLVVASPPRVAAQGQGPQGVAVVACPSGDDLVFHRLAPVHLVLPGHLHRRLHRLGAAGKKIDPAHVSRGNGHQLLGQGHGGRGGELGAVGKGHVPQLGQHGLRNLPEPVSQGGDHRSAGAVDIGLALRIVEINPFAPLNRRVPPVQIAVEDIIIVGLSGHGLYCYPSIVPTPASWFLRVSGERY